MCACSLPRHNCHKVAHRFLFGDGKCRSVRAFKPKSAGGAAIEVERPLDLKVGSQNGCENARKIGEGYIRTNPNTALSPAPVAANVRRAGRFDSRPRTGLPRSTTIGPHLTAAAGFCPLENSAKREIWTFLADPLSTPLSKRAFCSGAIIAPSTTSSPIGL